MDEDRVGDGENVEEKEEVETEVVEDVLVETEQQE